jgi:predicted polyphosphate/ATP-dependent NAD kinase
MPRFHIALVVNPFAGLGGPSALKGSDCPDTAKKAADLGLVSQVPQKVERVLSLLAEHGERLVFSCAGGAMGSDYVSKFSNFDYQVVYHPGKTSVATDTHTAATELLKRKPDLLLFAGGDGTARDICSVIDEHQVVLGIPSGVKMHSGVFAITPAAVVSVVLSMMNHKLVAARNAEVRDIDEASFAQGQVITRHYGELVVPDDQLLVQKVKCSGLPDDQIALNEIAAFIHDTYEDDTLYILGSGGSVRHVKSALGIEVPTLLGVDVWCNGECVALDVNEPQLYTLLEEYQKFSLVLSVIGGQGIVLGRGNQQLSPRVLRKIGIENIHFIATQERLLALDARPLRVDSGDDELDKILSGYHRILCGYDDVVLYEIAYTH